MQIPDACDTGLVRRGELASRIAARAFVTRADVERVDKALTTEFLVSTTVMVEFLNAATGEVYHIQALTGSTNIRKDAGADLTPGEVSQAFSGTVAGTIRELAVRLGQRYQPGVRATVIQQLAATFLPLITMLVDMLLPVITMIIQMLGDAFVQVITMLADAISMIAPILMQLVQDVFMALLPIIAVIIALSVLPMAIQVWRARRAGLVETK